MKIVLISPYLFKSISVRMLMSAVKKTSHPVYSIFFKEIAPNNTKNPTAREYELFRNLIETIKPDLIGVSVRSTFFKQAKELSRIAKGINKDIFVIWGGIHPTVSPEHSLGYADAVCLGEGVYPLLEFIDKYAKGDRKGLENIPNIYIKDGDRIIRNPVRDLENTIDNYQDADWDEKNTFYIEQDKVFNTIPGNLIDKSYYVMSSFGCPFSCHYCCNDALREMYRKKGQYVRRRSVGRVINELVKAKALFPDLNVVNIVDDVFTFDRKWLTEFAIQYKEKVNVPFSCYAHPSMIDKEAIKILVSAGLTSITMGIQSGSENTRREVLGINTYMNSDITKAAYCLKDLGVVPCYDLLLDNPFEETKNKFETLDLLLNLPRPFDLHQHSLTFFPGVKLTKRAVEKGLIKNEFVECEEQKSMFRWTAELDGTRKPQDFFWDILFFMTRYPGVPKALIREFSKSKLLYRKPKIIYPLALMQKAMVRVSRRLSNAR